MSRREEVERLVETVLHGIGSQAASSKLLANGSLDRLKNMALESLPTRYTPREEVTEGWWSCVRSCSRTLVRVGRNFHGSLQVSVVNCDVPLPLEWFTDFLPVPAWLVEGIERGSDET